MSSRRSLAPFLHQTEEVGEHLLAGGEALVGLVRRILEQRPRPVGEPISWSSGGYADHLGDDPWRDELGVFDGRIGAVAA